MLLALNGLIGCPVAATDGDVGSVKDLLFDDQNWKVRWMVVDTGHWLPGRKVLIHPSAIAPLEVPPKPALPMMSWGDRLTVSVHLTKQQIESGPEAREDEPVTRQLESNLYDFYGWDPIWGASHFGGDAIVTQPTGRAVPAEVAEGLPEQALPGDRHLGSAADVKGFAVHATDGDLGHVELVLADDAHWEVRYLVVATRNLLPGRHVQLAPYAVTGIDWAGSRVSVNVTQDQVRSAPEWDPLKMADQVAEQQLHRHFGWPGYRW